MSNQLNGAKEICDFLNISESTFIMKVQRQDLPAARNHNHEWVSNKSELKSWMLARKRIEQDIPTIIDKSEAERFQSKGKGKK